MESPSRSAGPKEEEMRSTGRVFYTVLGRSIVDVIAGDGLGLWTRESEDQLRARYPDLASGTEAEADAAIEELHRKEPVEISAGDFNEALSMMPPVRHAWLGNTESFQCLEATYGTVANIWIRIGDRHFRLADRRSVRHDDLVRQIQSRFSGR